jgi:hypothetical protein
VFSGGTAMQPELGVSAGISELHFDFAYGVDARDISARELIVCCHFLFWQVDDLGEDSVTRGVQGGACFALFGFWAGAVLRVLAIGAQACFTDGFPGRFRVRSVCDVLDVLHWVCQAFCVNGRTFLIWHP